MVPSAQGAIVVGLDESPHGELALLEGLRRAATRGSVLHVVSVLDGYDPMKKLEYASARINLDADKKQLSERVAELVARHEASGGGSVEVHRHVLVGPAAHELAWAARSVRADLLIVGTHGRKGMGRMVLGSVAEELLRQAPCSVLVVRDKSWQ